MTDDDKVAFGVMKGKNVIIRPCLTKQNLDLLSQCHEVFKTQDVYKYVWADCRGTIKIRHTSTSNVIIIRSTNDILRIAPNATVTRRILCGEYNK